METRDFGYSIYQEKYPEAIEQEELQVGRILVEHKERYVLFSEGKEWDAEITGNLRYSSSSRADFPAVGDWVAFMSFDDSAIIHKVLPRTSVLERQAVGRQGELQVIAANVDAAFIVQAVDRDFNLNRLERYHAVCHSGGIEPISLLSKTDLISHEDLQELIAAIEQRLPNAQVLALSSQTGVGMEAFTKALGKGRSYCLIGSSGVGKSSLVNALLHEDALKTASLSDSTHKGRHTTSHRQMFLLSNGSILIDTPGMRELGMGEAQEGIQQTFGHIEDLSQHCKFVDCTHQNETDCAVTKAVKRGEISQEALDNYHKLKREQEHFSSTVFERRQKDKEFGKMVKQVMKHKKR